MRVFADPMLAGLVWRVALLLFVWIMYLVLRSEDSDHEWWGDLLVRIKLSGDNHQAVESSRLLFRWATYLMLLVVLWHGGAMFHRTFPNFPFAREQQVEKVPEKLPERVYGAGVSGKVDMSGPRREGTPGPVSGPTGDSGKESSGLQGRYKEAGGE